MVKQASQGIQDLIDRTTGPKIKATVVVDQVYAADQHESLHYKHPRGGRAKYLELPMYEGISGWLRGFADRLLVRGTDTSQEWAKVGRKLKNEVPKNAPVEFGDLRGSASLVVREGASVVVNEPAKQPRLTEAEIDYKAELRRGLNL